MDREYIGSSSALFDIEQLADTVTVNIPYGDLSYYISFSHAELDMILQKGYNRILDNKALNNYDYYLSLPDFALPLYIGARAINTKVRGVLGETVMDVGIITSTVADSREFRSRLTVGRNVDGKWSYLNYWIAPPLVDGPDTYIDFLSDH